MAAESAADRLAFFAPDDFGAEASYTPVGGAGSVIAGIFNDPHLSLEMNNVPISDAQPTFLCRGNDLPNGATGGDIGDTLEIGDAIYRVTDLQPDGSGMTLLTLAAIAPAIVDFSMTKNSGYVALFEDI